MKRHLFIIAIMVFAAMCLYGCHDKEPVVPEDGKAPEEEPFVEPDYPIWGKVSCGGKGIEGVVVTDGYEVTATDSEGNYTIMSDKQEKMVWISLPSGYMAPYLGVRTLFWQSLEKDAYTPERHDFELVQDGDQTNHTMLVFGDMHLANRTKDIEQFRSFTDDVNEYLAAHKGEKIYALTLGDMTWDQYWGVNNYNLGNYISDVDKALSGLTIFHTIGNHDHDMVTSIDGNLSGWNAVDWDTAHAFREFIGPNWYSYNIGNIHYIILDNIYTKNTTGGTSSDRHYEKKVCQSCLEWLYKDLSYVDKSTPVVVAMHAQLHDANGTLSFSNASLLKSCFEGYSDVTYYTGHTHVIHNTNKDGFNEHNSGAVCATWWWCGYYNRTVNIGEDGSPAGYRIVDYKGSVPTSRFKATGRDETYQFRSYDRNAIKIDTAGIKYSKEFAAVLSKYGAYNTSSSANEVLINIWDWDSSWKIEVTENGNPLTVTQPGGYDPLYGIAYYAYRFKSTASPSFNVASTRHLFKVKASSGTSTLEIKVTDDEGRTYTETMQRPKAFTIDTYK